MKSAAMGRAAVLLSAVALVLALGGAPAYASTIAVNTTDDELNADGDCSLREAIQAANTDAAVDACTPGSGADTLQLPAGTYTLSIPGAEEDSNQTGDLDIASDLTLAGIGAASTIIDGNHLDRVVHVVGGTVTISRITLQHGGLLTGIGTCNGAGIFNGGSGGLVTVNGSELASLKIVDFPNPAKLKKEGLYRFEWVGGQGEIQSVSEPRVKGGYLERSNVNPVSEMVHLMAAYRDFEAVQRTIKTLTTDLSSKLIQETGRLTG